MFILIFFLLSIRQWELTHQPSSFKDIFDIRIGVYNLSLNSTDLIHSQSYSIANFTLVCIFFYSIREKEMVMCFLE